jgi:hypothetical protein
MSPPLKPQNGESAYTGLYTATFLSMGVALGAALNNIGLWLPVLLSIGVALDFAGTTTRNSTLAPDCDEQIFWTGDLEDDCTARWAGLLLRAERMDSAHWWWAVSEVATGSELASSNDDRREYSSGAAARAAAEGVARAHVGKP